MARPAPPAGESAVDLAEARNAVFDALTDPGGPHRFPPERAERAVQTITSATRTPGGPWRLWIGPVMVKSLDRATRHLAGALLEGAFRLAARPDPVMVFPGRGVPGEADLEYPVEAFVAKGVGRLSGWEVIRVRWAGYDADSDNWIAADELREMGDALFGPLYDAVAGTPDEHPDSI